MSAVFARPATLVRPVTLVESKEGSLHCLQAAFLMAANAFGIDSLGWPEAERLTGYVAGRETWPYEMFLSLADLGFEVVSIEVIDPRAMSSDPAAEIKRVFGDGEIGQAIIGFTDLDNERHRAERCLTRDEITFEVRPPSAKDVVNGISTGYLPIANVDYGRLHSSTDYEGHFVVVSGAGAGEVEIFDPGPSSDAARLVTTSLFESALHQPHDDSGMVILIRPKQQSTAGVDSPKRGGDHIGTGL